jgi:hypothetical protein
MEEEKVTKKRKTRKGVVTPTVILNEFYEVTLDPKCLILRRKLKSGEVDTDEELTKEEKKAGAKVLGYFSTWESLGSSLLKDVALTKANNFSKEDKLTFSAYIKIIKESKQEVVDLFKKVDDEIKVSKV